MRRPRLVAALLAGGLVAGLVTGCASSSAFQSTAREIGRLPEAERVRVPFVGLARAVSNAAGGPQGLRLAVFETSAAPAAPLGEVLARHAGPGWQRLLRVRGQGEDVVILARPEGDRTRLLLLAQGPGEVVLIEVAIDPAALLATVNDHGARFR